MVLSTMPTNLGNVFLSSGRRNRLVRGFQAWCPIGFQYGNTMPDIPLGDRPEKFGRPYLSLQPGDPLEEFGELLEGEHH